MYNITCDNIAEIEITAHDEYLLNFTVKIHTRALLYGQNTEKKHKHTAHTQREMLIIMVCFSRRVQTDFARPHASENHSGLMRHTHMKLLQTEHVCVYVSK